MNNQRRLIRDAIAAALATVYSGAIFTSRRVDARDLDEYVNVYLDAGDIEYEALGQTTTATVSVGYHSKALASDDELDEVADLINGVLESQAIAPDVIQGLLPAAFAYDDDQEQDFTSIVLQYTVTY